jgi:hypothetical protein
MPRATPDYLSRDASFLGDLLHGAAGSVRDSG